MARWSDIEAADAELAAHVRRCFGVGKHCTLATLRRDGSPRISGTEVEFADDGEIYLGMMPGSLKARDLRRDARLALHSPPVDPPDGPPSTWLGEAKLAGVGVEVSDSTRDDEAHKFKIDISEVVVTTITESNDRLLIRSWHPDRGSERRERA